MALIVDAGVLYAQADRAEPRHAAVVGLLRAETGPLITTAFVAAELDGDDVVPGFRYPVANLFA